MYPDYLIKPQRANNTVHLLGKQQNMHMTQVHVMNKNGQHMINV